MPRHDFVHVLCVKKRKNAHINLLEGEAFLLLLRWILRSRSRHCSRVVILVDSAVWLGAAVKGRSSTALNRLLRKAAALEMAGDVMVHLVLVPSAENPRDDPSRGVRSKRRSSPAQRLLSLAEYLRERYRMAASIVGFDDKSDSASSSSRCSVSEGIMD